MVVVANSKRIITQLCSSPQTLLASFSSFFCLCVPPACTLTDCFRLKSSDKLTVCYVLSPKWQTDKIVTIVDQPLKKTDVFSEVGGDQKGAKS